MEPHLKGVKHVRRDLLQLKKYGSSLKRVKLQYFQSKATLCYEII